MTGKTSRPYRMSFTTGGLFLNESLEVARLHREGESWEHTAKRALDQGTTTLPKSASNRRSLREITNRLRMLNEDERQFLLEDADRADQQAILWLATCRAYRFVGEFATDVIGDRYLSYQLDLPLSAFDVALNNKAEWDEGLAGLSASTRNKLRQILFRIMREAGILSQENRIQASIMSSRLKQMMHNNNPGELAYFPGTSINGA